MGEQLDNYILENAGKKFTAFGEVYPIEEAEEQARACPYGADASDEAIIRFAAKRLIAD